MKAKRILSLILSFLLVLSSFGTVAFADEESGISGESTEKSLYFINTLDDLKAFRDGVNSGNTYEGKYVELTGDIDLSDIEWTPVGTGTRNGKSYSDNAFKGIFDGKNHTISGLTITSASSKDYAVGLFGVVDGGTVKNLSLTNVNINVTNSDLAGGAIGMMVNNATADHITVGGSVIGHDGVGGIVGRMIISGTISNCTNNANVTSSYGGIGGIVGKAYYEDGSNINLFASISNCANNGTITAPMYVGGIVGLTRSNVSGCVNNGVVDGGTQTGGIIGQLIAAGKISGNENKAKISGKNHMGGIIGDYTQSNAYTYNNVYIENNTNRGELAATEQCAAIMGCNNIDGFTDMRATGNVSYYYVDGMELFGNPEDMIIDETNKFVIAVAKIGDKEYTSFADAIKAANAMTGDVTVEIYASVEFVDGMELKGNYASITFIGKNDDAKITINQTAGGDYLEAHGKTVAFTDLTLAKANPAWSGNSGHMGNYFSVQGGTVTYTNCIFPNGACTNTGTATYNNCTFKNTSEYGLWVYDDALVTVNDGTIDSKKGIKVYSEGELSVTSTLKVEGATFTENVTGKPAVAIGYAESVTLIGNTYNNTTGVLELDSGNDADCEGVTLVAKDADGKDIASTLTAVDRSKNGASCGVLVDGKIYTSVAQAAEVASDGSIVTLLHDSEETVELSAGVTLNKNGFTAGGITVAVPVITGLEGEGTKESPYVISSLEELVWFRDDVNKGNSYSGKFVKLTNDIDLNNEEWTPIGNSTNKFLGTFDGGEKTISNLKIHNDTSYVGLFGYTSQGELKNLTIHNVDIDGRLGVGALAGCPFTSDITNIKLTGKVTIDAAFYVGGVLGRNAYGDITDVTVDVDEESYVKATSRVYDPNSEYADEDGYVSYRTYVGGVVGFLGEGNHIIKNVQSNIKVIGDVIDIGGIAGIAHYENTFENISFTGSVEAADGAEEVGGIVGVWHNEAGTSVTFTDIVSTGTVKVGDEIITGSVVGGAYNSGNDTPDTSGSLIIDGKEAWIKVAQIGDVKYTTLEEAINAAANGDTITMLADTTLANEITLPAGITFNGNGKNVSGSIFASGNVTFEGHTKVTNFNAGYEKPVITIGEGACLELTGTGRMVIGHGATFNITGSITDAKNTDITSLTPSLIAAGASFTGAGVNFNVTNAYVKFTAYCSSKNKAANGTYDFNVTNSIWEQTGSFVFSVPTEGMDPTFDFNLKDSVLNSTSHLVFGVSKGEIVIDNSNVNVGTSRQIENQSTMTIKNGSVVNGAVATSSNAKNPGTIIIEDATYAVTGEFSGSDLGIGTIIVNKDAIFSAGSITKANITIDANGMTAGEVTMITADLSKFEGELSVINNNLGAKIESGKIVLVEKPVTISTVDELIAFAKDVNENGNTYEGKYVVLANDIDLAGSETNLWTPIGASGDSEPKFRGTFDGQGNTIKNLYVKQGAAYHAAGLFGATNGTIKNFTIDGAYVESLSSGSATVNGTAVVAGSTAYGATIDNVHVKNATVKGNRYVAGIVGYMDGTVTNCSVENVTLIATPDNLSGSYDNGDKVGGIVGYTNCHDTITPHIVSGCVLKGTVDITGYRDMGGLVGTASKSVIISDNTNSAKIKITVNQVKGYYGDKAANAGEFVGRNDHNTPVTNSTTTEDASFETVVVVESDVAEVNGIAYTTLADAFAAIGAGDVVIELLDNATMDYNAREAYGTSETISVTINGNGKTLTLNQKDSDWSSVGLANSDAKLVLKNMTIEKTGYGDTSGAWNTHAINFTCNVEMTDVVVNNSMSVEKGATLNNVTINEANGYYGLWIDGNGQTVTVNGGAINATNGGRGIKIADEYVDNVKQVSLNVTNTKFNTAKKAAVLVTSTAGAKVTANGVDITKVADDSSAFVWVDEDRAAYYNNVKVYDEAIKSQESEESFPIKVYKTDLTGTVRAYFKNLDDLFAAESTQIPLSDNYIELRGDVVAKNRVNISYNNNWYYNFGTSVDGGVTTTFEYADDWNYLPHFRLGENITLNVPYLQVIGGDIEIAGTVNTTYLYLYGTGEGVTITETGVVNANTGDATVQVKGGTVLTVNGKLNTSTLNVWTQDTNNSELIVSGANAEVNASHLHAWNGKDGVSAQKVVVENGATLTSTNFQADRGSEVTVDAATLTADTLTLGYGDNIGKLTVVNNGVITKGVVLDSVNATITGPEGMNVTTNLDSYKVVYNNGVYSLVEVEKLDTRLGYVRNLKAFNKDNVEKYQVYLFAGIDSLDYQNVGYEVTYRNEEKIQTTKTVYSYVTAAGKDYYPDTFGNNCKYIMALEVLFTIDKTSAGESFTYRVFATKHNGEKIYSDYNTVNGIYTVVDAE